MGQLAAASGTPSPSTISPSMTSHSIAKTSGSLAERISSACGGYCTAGHGRDDEGDSKFELAAGSAEVEAGGNGAAGEDTVDELSVLSERLAARARDERRELDEPDMPLPRELHTGVRRCVSTHEWDGIKGGNPLVDRKRSMTLVGWRCI